jgi:WD40 repeat protein
MVREIELSDHVGIPGRSNRRLCLTPNGDVVAFCDAAGLLVGYRVVDGSQVYRIRVNNSPTLAVCPDPSLIGAGCIFETDSYRVWDLASGKLRAEIPLDSPVRRAAFSPDGKSVYIGFESGSMRRYRLKDCALLGEVATRILPVAISPIGDRYLGFQADTATIGELVLADLNDGRKLEVVNPVTHIVNDASFSPDGLAFVFAASRSTCTAMKTLELAEALHWLKLPAIDPKLAAASSDFLDYRRKLAESHIAAGQAILSDSSVDAVGHAAARDEFQKAHVLIQTLVDDFPDSVEYHSLLVASFKRLAQVEIEPLRRGALDDALKAAERAAAKKSSKKDASEVDSAPTSDSAEPEGDSPDVE